MAKKQPTRTLESASIDDLRREVVKREAVGRRLAARRDRLLRKAAEIDTQLKALGVTSRIGGRVPRAKNDMSLVDALAKMLKGKEMGIPAIVGSLSSVGYVSQSPNLRTMVNLALLKKSHFKRVGRGVYTARA